MIARRPSAQGQETTNTESACSKARLGPAPLAIQAASVIGVQAIDATWDARLSSTTDKFQEIAEKARTWSRPPPGGKPGRRELNGLGGWE